MQPSNRATFALALLAVAGVLYFNVYPWVCRQVRVYQGYVQQQVDRYRAAQRHLALNAYIPGAVGRGDLRRGNSPETIAAHLGPPVKTEETGRLTVVHTYGDYQFEFFVYPAADEGLQRVYGPYNQGHSSCYLILEDPRRDGPPTTSTEVRYPHSPNLGGFRGF